MLSLCRAASTNIWQLDFISFPQWVSRAVVVLCNLLLISLYLVLSYKRVFHGGRGVCFTNCIVTVIAGVCFGPTVRVIVFMGDHLGVLIAVSGRSNRLLHLQLHIFFALRALIHWHNALAHFLFGHSCSTLVFNFIEISDSVSSVGQTRDQAVA